jgi:hypothetical protein
VCVGRGTATMMIRSAMSTATARSPAWTRGGKKRGACIAHVAMGGGERGGKRRESRRGGQRLLKRRRDRQGRGGGRGRGATRGRENGEERGGPGAVEGTVRWSASAPSWQPRAAGLWHDKGGRRGAGDPARARLTDRVGRRQGPAGSAWVREGVRGSEAAAASGH